MFKILKKWVGSSARIMVIEKHVIFSYFSIIYFSHWHSHALTYNSSTIFLQNLIVLSPRSRSVKYFNNVPILNALHTTKNMKITLPAFLKLLQK